MNANFNKNDPDFDTFWNPNGWMNLGTHFFGWHVKNFGVEDVPSADKLGKGVEEGVGEWIKLRNLSDR